MSGKVNGGTALVLAASPRAAAQHKNRHIRGLGHLDGLGYFRGLLIVRIGRQDFRIRPVFVHQSAPPRIDNIRLPVKSRPQSLKH